MPGQTKIVATLGPATDVPKALQQMIKEGVNVVRLNFSHGSSEDHIRRATLARACAKEQNRIIAVLGDLQGPKIRIAGFATGKVQLHNGEVFVLDATLDSDSGTQKAVGLSYPSLVQDCKPDDILLLDDGRLRLKVEDQQPDKLITRVIAGGELSNRKGINRLGGGINAPSLTRQDLDNIGLAAEIGCDYLALSFVRHREDIQFLRQELQSHDYHPYIVAKIERNEAVADQETIDGIIIDSDCVMVARGDLGVELGEARLVGVQKHLIQRAVQLNRSVITATQMMESMIENIIPTRAEVFDVANAVLDGTDAVMLSAETASGNHPSRVVAAMHDICVGAEQHVLPSSVIHLISDKVFDRADETIAYASLHTALQLKRTKAIVSFTESGDTPMWISRVRGNIPIIAVSRNDATLRRMAMWRGVFPVSFDITTISPVELAITSIRITATYRRLESGDNIIITRGSIAGISGTDRMQIITITDAHLAALAGDNTATSD